MHTVRIQWSESRTEHPTRRADRERRIKEFLLGLRPPGRAAKDIEAARVFLQLLLTRAPAPQALAPLRTALSSAMRTTIVSRRSQFLVQAAQHLVQIQNLVPQAEGLRQALLTTAFEGEVGLGVRLQVLRELIASNADEQPWDQAVPRLEPAPDDVALEELVAEIGREMLGRVGERPRAPFDDLDRGALVMLLCALRLLYCHCRLGLGNDCYPVSALTDDFDEVGVPIWDLIVVAAVPGGAPDEVLSPAWAKKAQALVRLRLMSGSRRKDQVEPSLNRVEPSKPQHVVCKSPIPRSSDKVDRDEIERHVVLEQPLPVADMPTADQVQAIRATLLAELPWAEAAIKNIFDDLLGRALLGVRSLSFRPTLLVGTPGCGKSRLCRRIAEELALPRLDLPLGGISDAKILSGTSRGWASGRPSDLATCLASHRQASAIVLLDELDKAVASTSQPDGGIQSYLLGLLEQETAVRHRDVFLKTECDYRYVLWLATANRISVLPKALQSRFRILLVPQPTVQQLPAVAESVRKDLAREWGIDEQVLPAVDELALEWHAFSAVRQVRDATTAALLNWATSLTRH